MLNKSEIKILATKVGFHKVGIAPVKILDKSSHLIDWLNKGFHGQMDWMQKNLDKRLDVRKLYPDGKSVIAVAHNYYTSFQHSTDHKTGKISRYAWGKDYHKIIKKKLKDLLQAIKKIDSTIEGRLFVDTAPIQDKLWAQEAGIGWQGKNSNILTREMGSWIFLGELVLNKELDYDKPAADFCGSCSACIDACPTQALTPYKLDANKCISYLTIEYWDKPIPEDNRDKMNRWIFGCDICQDVCPWNKFAKETDEKRYQPDEGNLESELRELSNLSEEEFKRRFKHSPVSRAKYKNFIRNVNFILLGQTKPKTDSVDQDTF